MTDLADLADPIKRAEYVARVFDVPVEVLMTKKEREVMEMGFKKHGTGDGRITETEGSLAKTAAGAEFTEADKQALAKENADADNQTEEA